MKAVIKILQRSLVLEFFKQNAAFFGFALIVLFGFIRGSEHLIIGKFLVNNHAALMLVYMAWMAYGIKVAYFLRHELHKVENQFLSCFSLLNVQLQISSAAFSVFVLLLPIWTYSFFLIFLAIQENVLWPIVTILGFMGLLTGALTIFLKNQLQSLPIEKAVFQLKLFRKITLLPQFYFIAYLLRQEVVLLFLSKLYGCLVIIGAAALYSTGTFDLRVMTTGVLLAAVGNVAIIHKYVSFQYHSMAFTLNLPIRFLTVIAWQIVIFAILLIPEFIVLFRYYPLQILIPDITGLLLFAISLNLFLYGWMLLKQTELSNFMVVLFWNIVALTLLILFSVHPLILACFLLVNSIIIVYFRHYQYEHIDQAK